MIKGLHHNAYRCRDSEETRRFYEDFIGLPLAGSLDIAETKTGRKTAVLHTFYRLDDGSYLAFFEVPDMPFEWKAQHDYDLHIALEVEPPVRAEMLAKGKSLGIETRGISDRGFVRSIYFRDPNGYVIELTAKTPEHARMMDPSTNGAPAILDRWQAAKAMRFSRPPERPSAHLARPDATHASKGAPERGLSLIAEALRHLGHRRAARPQHLVSQVHAPGGKVLHRRAAEQCGAASPHLREAFLQGLRDLGYVEGRNVVIEYRADLPRNSTVA